jgi:antitoxin YefM
MFRLIMRIINFSDARNKLRSVLDQVVEDADVTVITRRDAPDVVVMSLDHYSSLMETVHLLSSPANAAHLAKSIAQLRAGQHSQHALIDVPAEEAPEPDAQHPLHG